MNLFFNFCLIFIFLLFYNESVFAKYIKSTAKEKQNDKELSYVEMLERKLKEEGGQRKQDLEQLQEIKLYIINGNIERAKAELLRLDPKSEVSKAIKASYLAIIEFVLGNYEESLSILRAPELTPTEAKRKTCVLKLANMVIVDDLKNAKEEFDYCSSINGKFSTTDLSWLEFLLGIRQKKDDILTGRHLFHINRFSKNIDMIRLWLKMGIYLNHEHHIFPRLKYLGAEIYQSKKIRELLGLLYYRLAKDEESMKFIDDIMSANSENIQGNLNLEKKQYELAFGHFQLALKKKHNSVNAIERSLTLAWLLGKFAEGLEIARKIHAEQGSVVKKRALLAAFLTRNGKHKEALSELYPIVQTYQGRQPPMANELLSYNSLLAEKNDDAKKYTDILCRQKDGFSCWMLFHLNLWDDLGKTIKRDDAIFQDNDLSVENLKKEVPAINFEEEILVDQRDIEELDEMEVQKKIK